MIVDAVILTVDTAERSGWSRWRHGVLEDFGEVEMLAKPRDAFRVVQQACKSALPCRTAYDGDIPLVLVYEEPFYGTNQGRYIGAWRMAWNEAGCVKSRWLGVRPQEWRTAVFPKGRRRGTREQMQAREMETAKRVVMPSHAHRLGPDSAAAVCMGVFATRSPLVDAKLPKKRRGGI